MLDDLKNLCALSGVSGNEDEVRDYILSRVNGCSDDVTVDSMGNVIVYKKGDRVPAKKIMLCAHMDEVGVIVTRITDDGYLKFAMIGGVDSRVIAGKAVVFGRDRVFGVIGCKAAHLVKGKERDKTVDVEDLFIDIGAKNREEAEKFVSIGDAGAFEGEAREFGDGFLKAKAIDDRFGCAVLLALIESRLPVDCIFAFTVQEEVGLRGACPAAYRASPDIALIVEATTAADLPSVSDNKKVCRVGSGAVVPFMDKGTIYDRELYGTIINIAEKNEIPWQTKNVVAAATDGASVQRSRMGVKTAAIAAPVRNLHSPSCVVKISDMEAVSRLTRLSLYELGARSWG
ncbi:MAG: M42 family peptidase [Oscillospiraceae bacterium]|jgi:endoglucanase|nr:M42 family peptidase [Oscillospiraceae bacterium]